MNRFEEDYKKYIKQFFPEETPDKCEYLNDLWNFCGCSCYYESVRAVKEVLLYCKQEHETRNYDEMVGAKFFMLYWATQQDYIEHGSGVIGSWLTDLGKELLEFIETIEDL